MLSHNATLNSLNLKLEKESKLFQIRNNSHYTHKPREQEKGESEKARERRVRRRIRRCEKGRENARESAGAALHEGGGSWRRRLAKQSLARRTRKGAKEGDVSTFVALGKRPYKTGLGHPRD
jgi:hypothetical protein